MKLINVLFNTENPVVEVQSKPEEYRGLFLYNEPETVYIADKTGYVVGTSASVLLARERIFQNQFNWNYIDNAISRYNNKISGKKRVVAVPVDDDEFGGEE